MQTASGMIVSIWKSIPKNAKCAFFAAFAVGMIAHMPFAANHFINFDSLFYITRVLHNGPMAMSGRWLQGYITYLGGRVVAPNVDTVVSMLLIGFTGGLTVSSLKIKKSVYAMLVGALLALIPAVTSSLLYQEAISFFTALFLAAAAVFCTVQWNKRGWIGGMILLTLSLGTYPAYIGYSAGLFIILCICRSMDAQSDAKSILCTALKYLGVLAAAVALYYIIMMLWLTVTGHTLVDYRGIDDALYLRNLNFDTLVTVIRESYRKVLRFFWNDAYGQRAAFNPLKWIYRFMVALFFAATAFFAGRNRLYKSIPKLLLTLLFLLLFPLAIHAIGVLGLNANTHWLMIYAFVLAPIYVLKLADSIELLPVKPSARTQDAVKTSAPVRSKIPAAVRRLTPSFLICALTLLMSACLAYVWFTTDNRCYQKMRFTYEHAYATCVQLATDIFGADGFDPEETRVALLVDETPYIATSKIEAIDVAGYSATTEEGYLLGRSDKMSQMLTVFVGAELEYTDIREVYEAYGYDEVESMPVYPREGSIQMVGDILVVKLSEVGEHALP